MLYDGEYVVRSFLLNGVFLSCDHGRIFYISLLCDNSINQSINDDVYVVWSSHRRSRGVCIICINRVRLPILRSWSAEQGKLTFPCPRSRLRIWSRETGSAVVVPSRVNLVIISCTQAESIIVWYLLTTEFVPISAAASIYLLFKPPPYYAIGSVPRGYRVR